MKGGIVGLGDEGVVGVGGAVEREGWGVAFALSSSFSSVVVVVEQVLAMKVVLLLCEVRVEYGGVGGDEYMERTRLASADSCSEGVAVVFSCSSWSARSPKPNGIVFLLLLETQPSTGLRLGIAGSEAALRLPVGGMTRLAWLLEPLKLSGVLINVSILSDVFEY